MVVDTWYEVPAHIKNWHLLSFTKDNPFTFELLLWIDENIESRYYYNPIAHVNKIFFEKEDDLILTKLTWL